MEWTELADEGDEGMKMRPVFDQPTDENHEDIVGSEVAG